MWRLIYIHQAWREFGGSVGHLGVTGWQPRGIWGIMYSPHTHVEMFLRLCKAIIAIILVLFCDCKMYRCCEIWGCHSVVADDLSLLACDAESLGELYSMSYRLPSSSGSSIPRKLNIFLQWNCFCWRCHSQEECQVITMAPVWRIWLVFSFSLPLASRWRFATLYQGHVIFLKTWC
jgi:hypothetical protein